MIERLLDLINSMLLLHRLWEKAFFLLAISAAFFEFVILRSLFQPELWYYLFNPAINVGLVELLDAA